MRRSLALALLLAGCATTLHKPNAREWNLLMADYQWIQTLRAAQKNPGPNASRKEQIGARVGNFTRLQPTYVAFMDRLRDYHDRTGDGRAATILAREKIALGDEYMNVLSRYDKAIELYRQALEIDSGNVEAQQRIAVAEQRRFVSMNAFALIKTGMREEDVSKLAGLPREDWIKQVMQNGRLYSVWIYPKSDGGASAIYFDSGVVYHTNWNAAAPPAYQTK